ncbi:MAG: hypothetical protein IKX36_00135 [Prevotella sp.]|nr:hypothetical protein [Prevotella sp.]
MKKYLLMSVMLVMTMVVAAQTYNNPRQRPNRDYIKVTKVERTKNSTIVYLHVDGKNTSGSVIDKFPSLTDEATGKKYQATKALNFQWGKVYQGACTFRIQFPALPSSTSVVTYRETGSKPWIISNIALPIKSSSSNKKTTTTSSNNGKTIIINVQ